MTGRPHRPPPPGLRPPLFAERVLYPSVLLLFRCISKEDVLLCHCAQWSRFSLAVTAVYSKKTEIERGDTLCGSGGPSVGQMRAKPDC